MVDAQLARHHGSKQVSSQLFLLLTMILLVRATRENRTRCLLTSFAPACNRVIDDDDGGHRMIGDPRQRLFLAVTMIDYYGYQ